MLLALSLRSSLTETEPPFVGAERVVLSFLFLISPARPRRHYGSTRAPRTRARPSHVSRVSGQCARWPESSSSPHEIPLQFHFLRDDV